MGFKCIFLLESSIKSFLAPSLSRVKDTTLKESSLENIDIAVEIKINKSKKND